MQAFSTLFDMLFHLYCARLISLMMQLNFSDRSIALIASEVSGKLTSEVIVSHDVI